MTRITNLVLKTEDLEGSTWSGPHRICFDGRFVAVAAGAIMPMLQPASAQSSARSTARWRLPARRAN